jgi:hypothetical protein
MIDLFFAWEPLPFTLVTEHLFRRDYLSSKRDFCSPALVNAILALSERYLDFPGAEEAGTAWSSLGDGFAKEARQALITEAEDGWESENVENKKRLATRDLPSVQALGLLAMREMRWGRKTAASMLSEEAIERAEKEITSHEDDAYDALDEKNPETCAAWAVTLTGLMTLIR